MKKYFFLSVAVIALSVFATSCSNDLDDIMTPTPEIATITPATSNEYVDVNLGCVGDYVSVDEGAMGARTRAAVVTQASEGKKFYAFQVDTAYVLNKGTINESTGWKPYAYGLFNDMEKAHLYLKKGVKTRIQSSIIIEREDTLFHIGKAYSRPFCAGYLIENAETDTRNAFLDNQFYMSAENSLELDNEYIQCAVNSAMKIVRVDHYYGVFEGLVNNSDDINIDMNRSAFAFTYNVTPPADGSITISMPDFGNRVLCKVNAGDEQTKPMVIYNFPTKSDKETCNLKLKIQWTRGESGKNDYNVDETVTIKKGNNYTLNVDMSGRDGENNFNINVNSSLNDGGNTTIN